MRTPLRTIASFVACSIMLCAAASVSSQTKQKKSLQAQVNELQSTVKKASEHQRDLEARITVLERLSLTASPEVLRAGYTKSSRDAIINDLANLSSNAYQYRIRPTTMGGGGGTYVGFKITKFLASRDYATYDATAFQDSVVLRGIWTRGEGVVQAVVGMKGDLGQFTYTGDFE